MYRIDILACIKAPLHAALVCFYGILTGGFVWHEVIVSGRKVCQSSFIEPPIL